MAKMEYCHRLLFHQLLNINPAQPCDSTTGCGASRCNSGGVGNEAQPGFENQNRWESVKKKSDLLKSGMRLTLSATSSLQVPHLASRPALSAWLGELAGSTVVDFMDRLSTVIMVIADVLTICFLGCGI